MQCGGGLAKAEAESEDLSKAGLSAILLAEHQASRNFSCVLGGNKKIPTSNPPFKNYKPLIQKP